MINPYLKARLLPVWQRHRRWQTLLHLTIWLVLAALGSLTYFHNTDAPPAWAPAACLAAMLAGAALIWLAGRFAKPDFRALAQRIETRQPALDGRLLTAVQVEESADPVFIQERLLQQTIQHALDHDWSSIVSPRRISATRGACYAAAAACAAVLLLATPSGIAPAGAEGAAVDLADGVGITPGDTEIEKDSSLLVMARFSQPMPASVELVTGNSPETERRQFLVRSLNDPVFAGSVPGVMQDFRYRVEYDGRRTREFSVRVFEYPRLERPDVTLIYPKWTGLPDKRIEDAHRASAVEGTLWGLDLQLNKPVVSAVLKARGLGGADIPLTVHPANATATLRNHLLAASQVYDLILTDSESRTNKVPATFTFDVLPNRPPDLKLASPRGDQRPSALEELVFEGTVSDDFGLVAWGLGISKGGGAADMIELGREAPGSDKRSFKHLLSLEESGAKPDELLSWFVWADDIGPDGKPRRTESDLHFGEVRAFDEIFRQGDEAAAEPPPPGGAAPGNAAAKLAELQKQIINATWKLLRTPTPPPTDIKVVRDSQADALAQATENAAEADDARMTAAWATAKAAMSKAGDALQSVLDQPAPLTGSLAAEQAAYQALLAVQAREHRISKSKQKGPPGSAEEQQRQEELEQLDLANEENRYELEREAAAPQEAEQREQRQVLSRLQELAKRMEEVNQKLKELQNALQAAPTEAERQEVKRELKRLEEEQRQMLADVDELSQRMNNPENQEKMAQEKQALEEARKHVQEASKATAEGDVPKALASGTRAERQLQEMREDLRKKNSTALSQDLRDLRSEARDLASRQEKVTKQLEQLENPREKALSDTPQREAAERDLAVQQQRTERLTKKAAMLSTESESAEPLVSRQLYDTMRQYAQEDAASVKKAQEQLLDAGRMTRKFMDELTELQQQPDRAKVLEMTSGLLKQDLLEDAKAGSGLAAAGIENLKSGIERAAGNVLGDDTEALKRADRELDALTKEIEKEIAEAGEEPSNPNKPGQPGQSSQPVEAGGEGPPSETASNKPGEAKGKGQDKGGSEGDQPGEGRGQGGGPNNTNTPGGQTAGGRGGSSAPMTGDGYAPWSDRLRDVEEMVDFPDLRNNLAQARERARELRVETKRDLKKPDWAVVRSEILKPLVEVRQQVREEVARRTSEEALVPIDRDPVPGRYAELVRRYYEQLGKDP
jgi:hypothetical protein